MPESWLHLDIVHALIAVIFGHCFRMYRLYLESGYIKTLFVNENWLYQDSVSV